MQSALLIGKCPPPQKKMLLLLTFSIRSASQELVNTSEEIKLRMINITGHAQV